MIGLRVRRNLASRRLPPSILQKDTMAALSAEPLRQAARGGVANWAQSACPSSSRGAHAAQRQAKRPCYGLSAGAVFTVLHSSHLISKASKNLSETQSGNRCRHDAMALSPPQKRWLCCTHQPMAMVCKDTGMRFLSGTGTCHANATGFRKRALPVLTGHRLPRASSARWRHEYVGSDDPSVGLRPWRFHKASTASA